MMWRASALLRRLTPRADSTLSAKPLQACCQISSSISSILQIRGFAAALATGRGTALALLNRSIGISLHSAHQPTAARFTATAIARGWASASASSARRLHQQAPAARSSALRVALRTMPRVWAVCTSPALPSARTPAAVRCLSNSVAAARSQASIRKPLAAAAAVGRAHIRWVMRLGAPLASRQLMAAARGAQGGFVATLRRTWSSGMVAKHPVGAGKRGVLHPTAILAARSSRHFSSLSNRGPYNTNRLQLMLRQSMDPTRVLYALMGLNVAGFISWRLAPAFMERHGLLSLPAVREGRPYTLLTSAFSQRDTMHLLSNMLGLYFFGREVGGAFGGRALLGLYIAGGLVGSIAHCLWRYSQILELPRVWREGAIQRDGGALGASGAVNAIMIVNVLLYPMQTVLLYGILPMPMIALGGIWLYLDISGTMKGSASGVGHVAHLGGALTGFLFYVAYRLGRIPLRGYW